MAKKTPGGKDRKVRALQAVFSALERLQPAERSQVLASVAALLEMPTLPASMVSSGSGVADAPRELSPSTRSEPSSATRRLSIVELVNEKRPQTNTERIALFAYYREKIEGQAHFVRADLRPYFIKARIPIPANYDRDFVEAVRRGWIHEDESASYLTSLGLEAVEKGFSQAAPTTRTRRRAAKPKKKKRR